jgi:hypothetical protein
VAAKKVVASVPNIYVGPAHTPASTPIIITPAISSWYTQWGQNLLNAIFSNFTILGQRADENDIPGIASACWSFAQNAETGLTAPAIPDQTLDQQYRTSLTQLKQGGIQCQEGIQAGDPTIATNGLNLLGQAGTVLAELQEKIAPSN